MKKIYLLVTFFMAVLISQAQIKKGGILLGGNVGFSTQSGSPGDPATSYTTTATSFFLNPSYGKAVRDNLLIGFDLSYSGSKNYSDQNLVNPGQTFTGRIHDYGAGFFVRRYKNLGSGFSLFLQGRLGVFYQKQTDENTNSTATDPDVNSKEYIVNLGFYPGISYAVSRRVQLETGFQNLIYAQYSHQRETFQEQGSVPSDFKQNNFSLGTSLSNSLSGFVVGVRILLGGS
jgi:hypothetical protein